MSKFYLDKIKAKRALIGDPLDLYGFQAELLLRPGGKREKAIRATHKHFATDPSKGEGLCKDLKDNLYKDELYDIAIELDLPVTKKLTKAELCQMIEKFVIEANIPVPEQISVEEASKKLKRVIQLDPYMMKHIENMDQICMIKKYQILPRSLGHSHFLLNF